jgi:hypothetical protein
VVFELRGKEQLLQFALERFFAAHALARELLRNRAAALHGLAGLDHRERGADDADWIETVMLVKPPILDGDDRFDESRGHLRERDLNAVFLGNGKNFPIGRVEKDVRGRHRREGAKLVPVWNTADQVAENPAKPDQKDHDGRQKHAARPRLEPPCLQGHPVINCNRCTSRKPRKPTGLTLLLHESAPAQTQLCPSRAHFRIRPARR